MGNFGSIKDIFTIQLILLFVWSRVQATNGEESSSSIEIDRINTFFVINTRLFKNALETFRKTQDLYKIQLAEHLSQDIHEYFELEEARIEINSWLHEYKIYLVVAVEYLNSMNTQLRQIEKLFRGDDLDEAEIKMSQLESVQSHLEKSWHRLKELRIDRGSLQRRLSHDQESQEIQCKSSSSSHKPTYLDLFYKEVNQNLNDFEEIISLTNEWISEPIRFQSICKQIGSESQHQCVNKIAKTSENCLRLKHLVEEIIKVEYLGKIMKSKSEAINWSFLEHLSHYNLLIVALAVGFALLVFNFKRIFALRYLLALPMRKNVESPDSELYVIGDVKNVYSSQKQLIFDIDPTKLASSLTWDLHDLETAVVKAKPNERIVIIQLEKKKS